MTACASWSRVWPCLTCERLAFHIVAFVAGLHASFIPRPPFRTWQFIHSLKEYQEIKDGTSPLETGLRGFKTLFRIYIGSIWVLPAGWYVEYHLCTFLCFVWHYTMLRFILPGARRLPRRNRRGPGPCHEGVFRPWRREGERGNVIHAERKVSHRHGKFLCFIWLVVFARSTEYSV